MENAITRNKPQTKKQPPKSKNAKSAKKRKSCEGPSCSMFLADLTRKLQSKRRQEQLKQQEENIEDNIVHAIIDTLSNALPVTVTEKVPEKKSSPIQMETLQSMAPELLPRMLVEVTPVIDSVEKMEEDLPRPISPPKALTKIPRMPLASSDVFKPPMKRPAPRIGHDVAINTASEHDVASEIKKHVGTLKKISLIAEEFNQKTAKNLKEIVSSVQEDLIKKLEQIEKEEKLVPVNNVQNIPALT